MPRVDFRNPFLRDYYPRWLAAHERRLAAIRTELPLYAQEGRKSEKARARRTRGTPRPLAAVYDIDEVLLCNTHLSSYTNHEEGVDFHAADYFCDPTTGDPWGREDTSDPPIPGARELLAETVRLGVRPYFVTGRLDSIREVTIADFVRARFAGPAGVIPLADLAAGPDTTLIMVAGSDYPRDGESIQPHKEKMRGAIEKTHRIILNVGDQASDLGRHGDHQHLVPHHFYHIP